MEKMGNNHLYSFASSSSGNCSLLVCGETRILIDLGISVQKLRRWMQNIGMEIEDLDAVLLTHEHIDHVKGIKTFVKRYDTPIYATHGTANAVCRTVPEVVGRIIPYYGDETLQVGALTVDTFLTPHDAEESVGFVFRGDDLSFGYATDLGFVPSTVQNKLLGCSTVLLESNHDLYMLQTGPYPYYLKQRVRGARGHLSNDDSACLAAALARAGTKRFLLAHLSDKNNEPRLARTCCLEAVHMENKDCEVFVLPSEGTPTAFELD